jgi:predicted DNA binding CopG/RHH family protein
MLHRKESKLREEFQKKKFKSEEDEANWWDRQPDEALAAEFIKAAEEGTLTRGTVACKGVTPTTTIRLAPDDILLARNQASLRGLKYQTYLKMVIHKALYHEEEQRRRKIARENSRTKKSRPAPSRR